MKERSFISESIYSTYRVVTTSRQKVPRHLVVHDNLKKFTKYSERSVETPIGLVSVKCTTLCSEEIKDDI